MSIRIQQHGSDRHHPRSAKTVEMLTYRSTPVPDPPCSIACLSLQWTSVSVLIEPHVPWCGWPRNFIVLWQFYGDVKVVIFCKHGSSALEVHGIGVVSHGVPGMLPLFHRTVGSASFPAEPHACRWSGAPGSRRREEPVELCFFLFRRRERGWYS